MRLTAYIQDALGLNLPDFLLPAVGEATFPVKSSHRALLIPWPSFCSSGMVLSSFPGVLNIYIVL